MSDLVQSVGTPEIVVEVLPAGRAGNLELMQCCDRLRRALAHRVEGNVGMFAGFDRLSLLSDRDVPDVPVFVQLSLSRRLRGSHCVDFVALAFAPSAAHGSRQQGDVVVVAQGHGRTLSLRPSVADAH